MTGIRSYQIEHRCPQCSAPITLGESDHILSCSYCRVRLFLSFSGYPRYYLPTKRSDGAILMVPYWRSRGIEFSVRAGGIRESLIDRTWNASQHACFPSSLGIRPQTLKLRLMEPDTDIPLLAVSLPPDQLPPECPLSLLLGPEFPEEEEPLLFRTTLTDAFSVIYLPTLIREGTVYDAIDLKALGRVPSGVQEAEQTGRDFGPSCYDFVPAICPNCGNDLKGDSESCLVFCPTCMIGFSVSDGRLQDVPLLIVEGGSNTSTFLPFWRIRVEVAGPPLPRIAGRILPGGRVDELDQKDLFFWVPAFKINPQLFLRLGQRATTTKLQAQEPTVMPVDSLIQAITIPLEEAIKSVKLLLFLLSPKTKELPLQLNGIEIKPKEATPVLVPFEETGYELVNRQMQAAVHANALKYGRNL